MLKKKSIIIVLILILGVAIIGVLSLFLMKNVFIKKETTGRYGFHFEGNRNEDRIIENVSLPNEYDFFGRPSLNGDDMDSRLVNKYLFSYGGNEYYLYYSYGLEYLNTIYPDVYNAKSDEKEATLWEKPQGLFMLDNFLYYAYGRERRVREFNTHNFYFYYMHYKDYNFARLNLDTMESEKITRQQYEETWDYQEFRQWSSTISEPIISLDVFVWLDHEIEEDKYGRNQGYIRNHRRKTYTDNNYDTCFTLKNGNNPKYREEWYEYFIYNFRDAPTFSFYNSPNLIADNINDLNKMIAKYPDVIEMTIYQMNANHFTNEEMSEIIDKIKTPNENCVKTLTIW